jgi:sulfur-carrier protein
MATQTQVVVTLPAALIALFPGCADRHAVAANTVAVAIAELDRAWPGMRDRLCDSSPAVRPHIRIFVAGERAGLDTPLTAGDEVFVLTAISGG